MLSQLSNSLVPASLSGPVLLDQQGLPRYWATVWSTASTGQLAASTHLKKLRYIDNLYVHAESLSGPDALDNALGNLNATALAEILESWFVSIRNQPNTRGGDETRWQTGLGFVTAVVTWISKSDANLHLQAVHSRLQQLSILYSQLHVKKRSPDEKVRSLPASTIEALYAMLDPESEENPFPRIRTRWRIYVSFLLMLHQGMRRGEVLLLPADAVKCAFDRKL
jgi:integrase